MANRYDSGSVSKFNPLSFQELSAVPLMQRQKHDQLIAQQEMLRQGLAKVDPLDVHMNEAINLKSQIENKLVSQAELLSREGVNPNTQGDFLALNREYQNMVSPTGKLGQINAAKQVYAKNFNDFVEDAQKNKGWSRERALANWDRFSKQYTGFDNDNITSIGQLGAPKKVEVMDVLKDVKSLLGEQVVGEMRASGFNFKPGPDGSMVMVDRSGRRIETSNKPNLQAAQNLINQKLMGREWQDSIKFEGENTLNVYNQLSSGINSMLSNKVVDNRTENAQYIAAPKPAKGETTKGLLFNDAIQDPTTIKNLDKDTGEINFSKIGSKLGSTGGVGSSFTMGTSGGYTPEKAGIQTYKDVLSPLQQKFYETAAKRLTTSGRLSKGADLNNPTNAEKIGFYMKNYMKFPTVASDIIRADVAIDNNLFSGNLASKDATARNRTLTQDLRQTENGAPLRTMIDVESGKKIKFETGDKVDYLGVESPINYSNYGFKNNFEQSTMGHRAQILDKNGNVKANVVISRTPNEMKDPTFKKMYEINQSYKTGLNNLGEWVKLSGKYSGSKELSKTKVKVNDDNTFQIQVDGYETSPKLNNEQFIQQMQSIMEY
jgi:hypothetical protein